jgi:hypothetical protein
MGIDNWWFEANKNGLAEGLHTRHLQYTMPLRILQGHLDQALGYKKQLDNLSSDYHAETVSQVKSTLEGRISLIKDNMSFIKQRGWQGQLARQIELAHKRVEKIGFYSENCKSLLDDFLPKSKEATDAAKFESAEASYLKVSVGCVYKK